MSFSRSMSLIKSESSKEEPRAKAFTFFFFLYLLPQPHRAKQQFNLSENITRVGKNIITVIKLITTTRPMNIPNSLITGKVETTFAKKLAAVEAEVTSMAEQARENVRPSLAGISFSKSGSSLPTTSQVSVKTKMSSAPIPIMTKRDRKLSMDMCSIPIRSRYTHSVTGMEIVTPHKPRKETIIDLVWRKTKSRTAKKEKAENIESE
mmetsp:Transcript_12783/g.26052  ORF Transcript_12783/g.26052 Transcript_12783/m.26052 type:complete len:207 (+) Transcript_12783:3608-4228(+)